MVRGIRADATKRIAYGQQLAYSQEMRAIWFGALAILIVCGISPAVGSADEACVPCERKVLVSGDVHHGRGHESLTIEGAPRRGEEAFREEIYGTNFSFSVPDLPDGKYTVRIGLAEVDYLKPGQRIFDISCGEQILASNLDIFAAAGGAGKVYFITAQVDHPSDALHGPLTITFTAREGTAKLNTFELKDSTGVSIVSFRAADLINADEETLKPPITTEPAIWKEESQPLEARVRDLVRRLSLAEKVQQMRNDAPAIPRLDIPAYNYWSECLHGVGRAGIATVFPQAIGLAATWDTNLLHEIADTIATEARAKHNEYVRTHDGDSARYFGLTFWTPNINIFRDPRWGRGQETYGEDPFLTARLGVAFIRGLQGDDPRYVKAMACAKHFAVHSGPEPERHTFDAVPSERDLYETYLPHFEAAVREGHVGAVMGAYNSVDGEPACANPFLLTELLRKEWGFTGHVVSDCGAIYDIYANHKVVATSEEAAARAVKAGCDLCCGTDFNSLARAVKAGLISEREIDTAVGRLFEARFRLGLFDATNEFAYARIPLSQNDSPEHQALALQAAHESIVLLKNNGLLPLQRSKIKRIAVIGTNANSVAMLLGNYNGTPSNPITILEGVRSATGDNIEVVDAPGCPLALRNDGRNKPSAKMLTNTLIAARSADVIIYVGGISPQLEGEEMKVNYLGFSGGDRTRIELPDVQLELLKALQATGKPVVFVNCSGSAVAIPWAAKHLPAVVQAWYPGESGGRAVAEVLFGAVNPAGRLPVTFYRSTDQLPMFDDYSMSNRTYRYFKGRPLFAFGHGLSYTRFKYHAAKLDTPRIATNGILRLAFELTNTGSRDGDEVVQVYFRHVKSAVPQPKLALCGFERIHLGKGQTIPVTMDIPLERFRYWSTTREQYVVEPGRYELLVGAASDDIRARLAVRVISR
ncbi:MAG TPA: glycoside hydrolase family 3 C-terminal domain-containing protein [Verrucomicrobiae bacterium]|nr:glycoside hydrolase family 3 C-terminal domain-containing protein [Verrucomicrobiae bacterium]